MWKRCRPRRLPQEKTLLQASRVPHRKRSFLFARVSAQQAAEPATPTKPIEACFEDGAEFRWLNKKVLDSRVLDSMEDLSSWSFAGAGEMTLTEDHTKDGKHALRIRSTSNIAQVGNEGE